MSYPGVHYDDEEEVVIPRRARRQRRKKKSRGRSFLAVFMSLVVIGGLIGGVYWFGSGLLDNVTGYFGPPEDYDGPGEGEVTVEIPAGTTLSGIGHILEENDVVASSEAFVEAAGAEQIQAGAYSLMQKMKASDAVESMMEGTTIVAQVTIPEGLRVRQIVERVAEETDFTKDQLNKAVDALKLPEWAGDDPEGILFPAKYDVLPDTTAKSLVENMRNRFDTALEDTAFVANAEAADLTPHEALTIASIIQREVRNIEDMPGVAEVIFNRLADKCPEVPAGLLQMDSTVHYALDEYGDVTTSDADRQVDSPYNTYLEPGIPPGPIAAPGEDAMNAVFKPTNEGYCYFRTVDGETGETKFSKTEDEHNS